MASAVSRLANGQAQENLTTSLELNLLLETYLGVLDEYQIARRKLNTELGIVSENHSRRPPFL